MQLQNIPLRISRQLHSRRSFLFNGVGGLGSIALSQLLAQSGDSRAVDPLAPKPPHFPAKAKNVIFLFMEGAPSQARFVRSET